MKKKYFVKDGSRNYFIAEANLKDGSSNFSNRKKNEENTENAAEERGKEDVLPFDFLELAQNALKAPVTKRSLLSRIYDPLSLLCPAVLPLKLLFQSVCQLKLRWDDPLPERNSKLSVASCQLSVASCQLRVASCQLISVSCQLVSVSCYFANDKYFVYW